MKIVSRFHRDMHTEDELVSSMEKKLLPSVLVEQISGVFLSFANLIIMGLVSGAALAGVGQVSTINNAVMYFFSYFAMGGTVMVSQHMGENRKDLAKNSLFNSLVFGVAVTALVTLLMVAFRGQIIGALFGAAEEEVVQNSLAYFTFSMLATPFWFIYFQVGGILRGSGDAKTPMVISLLLNGCAVVFNILFVLVMDLGALGSGLATFLSVLLAALVGLGCLFRPGYELNLRSLKGVRLSLREEAEIVGIGLPSAVENLMFNGGKIILSVFLAPMGTAMISAYQVCMSAMNLLTIPLNSFNAMVVPIIGHLAGRREKSRTVKALRYLNRKTLWVNGIVAATMPVTAWLVCLLYTRDTETLFISVMLCYIYLAVLPLCPYCMTVPAGFKGVKDVNFCMIVATVCMWVFRVGGSYVLGVLLGWQAYGIMVGMALDSLFRCILMGRRFYGEKWLCHMDWDPEPAAAPARQEL